MTEDDFETEQYVVAIAMDAFRLAKGLPTRRFTADEVIRWLKLMKHTCQANEPVA